MRFDVVIGNPPYQTGTGGGGIVESSEPVYNKFIIQAIDIGASYISMIVPSRWCSVDKSALTILRDKLIESKHLSKIFNFENSKEVFENVKIAGGVMYFMLDRSNEFSEVEFNNCNVINNEVQIKSAILRDLGKHKYTVDNKTQSIIMTDNMADSILDKVKISESLSEQVMSRNAFGIPSTFVGNKDEGDIKVIKSNGRIEYTSKESIKNSDMVDKFKVVVGKISSDDGLIPVNGVYRVLTKPKILSPNEICSDSYLVIGYSDNVEYCENLLKYLNTKFVRFLINITLSGINISKKNFVFVPLLDFSIEWTDDILYDKYGFSENERRYIDSIIKEW